MAISWPLHCWLLRVAARRAANGYGVLPLLMHFMSWYLYVMAIIVRAVDIRHPACCFCGVQMLYLRQIPAAR